MAQSPLMYPSSLGNDAKQGQHYMLFSSYESKSAIASSGIKKSSIALYIPPNALQTTISQNYNDLAGGTTMAGSVGSATGALAKMKSGEWSFEGAWESTLGAAAATGNVVGGALTSAQKAQDFATAGFGLAKNNHIALAYRGPGAFRTHSFTFQFFPKNEVESTTVQKILKDFQNGSTPRAVGFSGGTSQRLTAPYFASPRHWEISFKMGGMGAGENPNLFKFQRSVITSFGVNHDPDSVVSFHQDGSPVHSTLTLTFQEIEYVLSGDAVSDRLDTTVSEMAALQLNRTKHIQDSSGAVNPHEARSKGLQ
jgi:hypothetical protein